MIENDSFRIRAVTLVDYKLALITNLTNVFHGQQFYARFPGNTQPCSFFELTNRLPV